MNQQPDLSIVIPTHNRRPLLGEVLKSLARQSCAHDRFEVIVVADACEDDTESMVAALAESLPYTLHVLSHNERSAALTRNRGVREARSDHLLFLDDDIVAGRDLVAAHMDLRDEMRVVLGYSKPVLPVTSSWWQQNARIWWEDRYGEMRTPGYRFGYRDFFSGNVSLSTNLFERVGGFDPAVGQRLEDYELGYRLLKNRAQFVHQPSALGFHHDCSDQQVWLRRVGHEGNADVQMSRRHNELASQLLSNPYEGSNRTRLLVQKLVFNPTGLAGAVKRTAFWLAQICENLRLRGAYWHVNAGLRELYYWSGVAEASGGVHGLRKMLQEAPVSPALDLRAPELDLAKLPDEEAISGILDEADRFGLRLAYDGNEIITLAPVPGYESLNIGHIERMFQVYLSRNFLPELSLNYLLEEAREFGH